MFFSSVFGLRVGSNVPLPGLKQLPEAAGIDVRVCLGPVAEAEGPTSDATAVAVYPPRVAEVEGTPRLRVWRVSGGGQFHFVYSYGVQFQIDGAGTLVQGGWREPATLEDAAKALLGPVLGFVLRLRGITCLHASVVVLEGKAVTFFGPCGAGKSTTAAALAQGGVGVLSDDVAALEERGGRLFVRPGVTRLRLWPASVEAMYGPAAALPRLTSNLGKHYLDLDRPTDPGEARPVPLAAVYVLAPRRDEPDLPRVEALAGREALMALVTDTYTNYLLDGPMRAREFAVLGRLVAQVPVRRVIPHASPARLARLCEVILEDYRQRRAGRQ